MKPVSIESTERFSRKLDNKKPYSIISDSNTFIDDEDEEIDNDDDDDDDEDGDDDDDDDGNNDDSVGEKSKS